MTRAAVPAVLLLASALASPAPTHATLPRSPRPPDAQVPRPHPGATCTATLTVRQTDRAAGCFIDERVTAAPGELRYPCGGGPATATFRDGVFTGTVGPDGAVSLSLRTTFHFSDDCDWQSRQEIRGNLRGARFVYAESPAPGQERCAPPCHAVGNVEVSGAP